MEHSAYQYMKVYGITFIAGMASVFIIATIVEGTTFLIDLIGAIKRGVFKRDE